MGRLYRVSLLGGEPEFLFDDVDSPVSFSPDGKRFVFLRIDIKTDDASLILHSLDDGKEDTLYTLHPKRYFFPAPLWSPDGNSVLCGILDNSGSSQQIKIMSVGVADHQSKIFDTPWYWMRRPAWLNKLSKEGYRVVQVSGTSTAE